ncbi:MAG: hypothetical protein COA44_02335 [Arcobacter sp.]|nr:MAG: hypothetical protein COA44_02335 [Arcobacter sp.]
MQTKQDLIIIGAGLSGLYIATLLQDKYNIIILEARTRLGGRILTEKGHDLGPSWVWPHQKHILSVIKELNLELFTQYTKGDALYDAPDGVQRFNAAPSSPSARVVGGLSKIIEALVSKLPTHLIKLNEEVKSITEEGNKLLVQTNTKQYQASYVLSTLAPRLACEHISYFPDLNQKVKSKMLKTPTWMGHIAKCVIEFETSFWRERGLSGFVFSLLGPLGEIHDASTKTEAALFGFVQANASTDNIQKEVEKQMVRLFPKQKIKNIYFIDWREEKFSSSVHDKKGLSSHPEYGLSLSHFNNKLFFMGTETSYDNGGYLEGAIVSALELAKTLGR